MTTSCLRAQETLVQKKPDAVCAPCQAKDGKRWRSDERIAKVGPAKPRPARAAMDMAWSLYTKTGRPYVLWPLCMPTGPSMLGPQRHLQCQSRVWRQTHLRTLPARRHRGKEFAGKVGAGEEGG